MGVPSGCELSACAAGCCLGTVFLAYFKFLSLFLPEVDLPPEPGCEPSFVVSCRSPWYETCISLSLCSRLRTAYCLSDRPESAGAGLFD